MMNNSGLTSFKLSLVFSILLHASAFLVFRTYLEPRRIIYTSGLPVQLRYFEPEPEKKDVEKKRKKEKKEEVNIKKKPEEKKVIKKPVRTEPEPPKQQQRTSVLIIDDPRIPAWYLNILEKKIGNNLIMPFKLEGMVNKKVVIYFRIMRNGEVKGIRIDTDSGETELNLSGLRAVRESTPFPPLPQGFDEEYLIVRYHLKIR